jgi:hypothetical protein
MTESELADLLAVTDRQVRRLVEAGVLVREDDGGFDPVRCARAYLHNRKDDIESRQARAEALRTETALKRLKMERQVGRLVDRDELRALADDLWSSVWTTWQAAASLAFHRLVAEFPEGVVRDALGEADQWAKADLHALRERLAARVAGAAVDLAQPERVERLMAQLAGDEDE